MFVCRRSVFKKSCSRGHQSVFLITTKDVSWPIDPLHIQMHVRLHVRFVCLIRHRGLFFTPSHSAFVFSNHHFSFLGNVTLRGRCFVLLFKKNMLTRAVFSRPSSFQFSVHVEHKRDGASGSAPISGDGVLCSSHAQEETWFCCLHQDVHCCSCPVQCACVRQIVERNSHSSHHEPVIASPTDRMTPHIDSDHSSCIDVQLPSMGCT